MGKLISFDFEIGKNYIRRRDGVYMMALLPREYPKFLRYGFLNDLISTRYPVNIYINLNRISDDLALSMIQRELSVITAELLTTPETSYKYSKLLLEKRSAENLRDLISARKTHLYRIKFGIIVEGKNYREAQSLQEKIVAKLRAMNFKYSYSFYRVLDVFKSMLPVFRDSVPYDRGRIAHTDVATAMFPFISSSFSVMTDSAILFGVNQNDDTPVFVDRFSLTSYNMLIFGKTGSGKSYFEKLTMIRSKLTDPNVIIYSVDPLGENGDLFEEMRGITIKVWNPDGDTIINPLDPVMGETIHDRVKVFIANLSTLFDLTREEKVLLDVILFRLFSKETEPTISDLIKEVEKERKLERVAMALRVFTEGSLAFLNGRSAVNLKGAKWINFDLSGVPDSYLPFFMFLVTNFVYSQIRRKEHADLRKLFYIDEVHHLWKFKECAELLEWMARHTRHYRTGMTLVTQSANDGFVNEHTRAIMENTQIHLLLYHDYLSDEAKAFYKLLPHEEEVIYAAHGGKRYGFSTGLLRVGAIKVPLKIIASREEDRLLQT